MEKENENYSSSQHYEHNRGEQDAKDNNYNPPWDGPLEGLTNSDKQNADRSAYDAGWRNTKDQ